MAGSAVGAVRHLIDQYRRFLRTSYRFLDDGLREQFETHLAEADVVVKGPYVTLAQEYEPASTLNALVRAADACAREMGDVYRQRRSGSFNSWWRIARRHDRAAG